MFSKVRDYIQDDEFRLTIFNDRLYAINYLDIISLTSDTIFFKTTKCILTVKGHNLALNKLLEKEVLIIGEITSVEVNNDW